MRCHFICLLAFLSIGYGSALQPAAATNPATSTMVASDDTDWFVGLGFTNGVYVSNGGLVQFNWDQLED